jgi:hypothetical protein
LFSGQFGGFAELASSRNGAAYVELPVARDERLLPERVFTRHGFFWRAATFVNLVGFLSMNTPVKVLLCIVAAVLALKFLPLLLIPVALGGLALLAVGGLLFSGVVAVAGLGLAALLALLIVCAVLSPIWIPVLAVVGVIALIRRSNRSVA